MQDQVMQRRATPGRILVVDDHAAARESMADVLRGRGHHVQSAASGAEALRIINCESFDLVLTDLQMPGMSGLDLVRRVAQDRLGVQVVMVTAHATVSSAVEAMRHGAFDYIEKPFGVEQLEQVADRALEHGRALDGRAGLANGGCDGPEMIGEGAVMHALRNRIAQVAPTSETVLIAGESGTGKELVARNLHAASRRAAAALIGLNCPVLSAQLMESELFGHCRGAFTGADSPRTGRFELADGGTILLDEVTEIDLSLQAKLLRVLQERSFERVGSSETIRVDVRVLATTNRDLRLEVEDGRFRQDLYFRLAVLPIVVPPLRERREDVPELIEHFLGRSARRQALPRCQLDRSALDLLVNYRWPGNIRELENIVTRASVLHPGKAVGADVIRPWLIGADGAGEDEVQPAVAVGLSLEEMERKLIEATLDHHSGHRAKTAQALGIGVRTLSGKLRSYGYAPREKSFAKAG